MPQLKVPRKIVSAAQLWISVLLVVLAMIFSLTPIITLKTFENADQINEMLDNIDIGIDLGDFPEEVEISAPKLISSITLIIDVVNAATGEDADAQKSLETYIESEEGKETLYTMVGIAASIMGTFDFEEIESDPFSIILNVVVSIIGLLTVLIMTLVIPIILIINCLVVVIKALKNIKTPENVSAAVGNKLTPMLSMTLTFMLFQCVVDGMAPASGITNILILAVVSVAINFVASRLREYPNEQFKYLNVVQLPSLVGLIGFLVFFFNLIETGIFKAFTNGSFSKYMAEAIELQSKDITVNTDYIIDGILMLAYLVIVLGCVSYLDKAARRVSCTVKAEKPKGIIGLFMSGKVKDNNVIQAIFTLAVYVLPVVVMGMKHYHLSPASTAKEGIASFLVLTPEQEGSLNGVLAGIIIMIVAEISIIVLKTIFCKKLNADEREELLLGKAKTSDEILKNAQKIVAAAEAKTAAAEAKAQEAETAKAEAEAAKAEAEAAKAEAEKVTVAEASDDEATIELN